MTGLRSLGVCYLAVASVFGVAAILSEYPDTGLAIRQNGASVSIDVADAADNLTDTIWQKALALAARTRQSLVPPPPPAARVELDVAPPQPWDGRTRAHTRLPAVPRSALARGAVTVPDGAGLSLDAPVVSDAEMPPPPPPAPAEIADARTRLKASLTPEMLAHFSLFLYVSKASAGPLAQRMYVFDKTKSGDLALLYDWPVSTGREKIEVSARGRKTLTTTPQGYYELDPARMYARYHSIAWNGSMPYAMFFNWEDAGRETGLAIHAATGGDIDLLGSRASAGCIHLAPKNAKALFDLIRGKYRGPMPQLAYDRRARSTSSAGEFAHDAAGHVKMVDGYKVLVAIENYGGKDVVAALF